MSKESAVTVIPQMRQVTYTIYASFPTGGREGDLAFATDRLVFYRWSGSAWQSVTFASSSGATGAKPAAADLPNGSMYFDTTLNSLSQVQAGAWVTISSASYVQGARAYNSALVAVADTTLTALALDSERWDTDTMHDTITNNSRLTCFTAGKYLIIAQCGLTAPANGSTVSLQIRLNGATTLASNTVLVGGVATPDLIATTIYDLSITDYVEMYIYHNHGGNRNTSKSANSSPEFMIQRIG